ncbi:hypothetical protein [Lichenifustis flavocetrariae]|uniref:Uncharacterized protein n=1 Tax=Lichenifustis flavocetrariae TaxID=2949735 RepID=A0AA42CIY4_9HYPH|nr:hypothetical protein [Lichenifustis flavocetrariae]MCW6509003.1 hypothetical protein [Lichenifustis flavocetrariae]
MSIESRFAVMTNWSLFAPFGAGFVLSGFRVADLTLGLFGFALLAAGTVSHLVINRVYGIEFSDGQIAVAAGLFLVALLGFLASWIAAPAFAPANVLLGLAGTAIVIAGAFAYVATRYGLRGAFSMFHARRPT